jgi:hypothetical protein
MTVGTKLLATVLLLVGPSAATPALARTISWSPAARPFAAGKADLAAVAVGTVADPQGDTFGFLSPQLDISQLSACHTRTQLRIRVDFFTPISPGDSSNANAVGGYIDLDTDQDSATGAFSHVDMFSPYTSGLGVDYYVDVFGFDSASGTMPLFLDDEFGGFIVGFVPASFGPTSFTVSIPLDLINDDGVVNLATVLGTFFEPTDAAPNGGSVDSSPVCPEDSGFLPPDIATNRCESAANRAAATLVRATMKCHSRAVKAATAGQPFNEETCEALAADAHVKTIFKLAQCPACIASGGAAVRAAVGNMLEQLQSTIYCDGFTPIDQDDGAFVPSNTLSARCEGGLANAAGSLLNEYYRCHTATADAAIHGRRFDEEACETAAKDDYANKIARLTHCPSCVESGTVGLDSALEAFVDDSNGSIYCAGSIPFSQ